MNRYRGNQGYVERLPEEKAAQPRRDASPLPSPDVPGPGAEPARGPAEQGAPEGRAGGSGGPFGNPGGFFGGPGAAKRPPGPLHDLMGGLDGILARLDPGRLETEDLLVLAILWLLYRESGDRELLIAMGAYLFL